MIRKLNEKFSPYVPEEIKKLFFRKDWRDKTSLIDNTLSKKYDLANMVYYPGEVPPSNRRIDNTPNRLHIYYLDTSYGPKVAMYDDQKVYSNPWIGDARADFTDMSWKERLKYISGYGYIDQYKSHLDKVRSDRRDSRRGSDLDPNSPLYRDKSRSYKSKRGDDTWVYESGYDKSGYRLNPDRLARKLYALDYDNYAEKLKLYYDRIEKLRDKVINVMTSTPVDDPRMASSWDLRRVLDRFTEVVDNFQSLKNNLERSLSYIDNAKTEEDRANEIKALRYTMNDSFGYGDSERLVRSISELRSLIKEKFPEVE